MLAEPPTSINGFLQRIGRGNRQTDKCRVWAVTQDKAQQQIYEALHHCAVHGYLDDSYEYQRHSAEFQQVISLGWECARKDRVLTAETIMDILDDHVRPETLDDMLATGALQRIGASLVPSQYWMDQGDKRQIHTVLAAASGIPIIDLYSGETVGTASRSLQTSGRVFTGTRDREIRAADESGVYLSPSSPAQKGLADLPTSRRKLRGLPRRLVWALAERDGSDPTVWSYSQGVLTTWGGGEFNYLLREALRALGYGDALKADSFGISGFDALPIEVPSDLWPLVEQAIRERKLRLAAANVFREPTAYHKHLGSRLQLEDSYGAVPLDSCHRWLNLCTQISR